ncbi:hypothetical protein AYI70_g10096 [Smittium culicis]|uniref:Uncharacterized protein n=1 Tax=Smittium culicis TaxID=133412 RepID=A0A1R1X852_9FUNG|nr:hypothetical protein AYI70_g10096 [Smittium culicis]
MASTVDDYIKKINEAAGTTGPSAANAGEKDKEFDSEMYADRSAADSDGRMCRFGVCIYQLYSKPAVNENAADDVLRIEEDGVRMQAREDGTARTRVLG